MYTKLVFTHSFWQFVPNAAWITIVHKCLAMSEQEAPRFSQASATKNAALKHFFIIAQAPNSPSDLYPAVNQVIQCKGMNQLKQYGKEMKQ